MAHKRPGSSSLGPTYRKPASEMVPVCSQGWSPSLGLRYNRASTFLPSLPLSCPAAFLPRAALGAGREVSAGPGLNLAPRFCLPLPRPTTVPRAPSAFHGFPAASCIPGQRRSPSESPGLSSRLHHDCLTELGVHTARAHHPEKDFFEQRHPGPLRILCLTDQGR